MKIKLGRLLVVCVFSVCSAVSAQTLPISKSADANLRQGYEAYRNEDWVSAAIFLKKVVSAPGSISDENYLMLIKSEIYSGEYKLAQEDCEKFLGRFPLSPYVPYVQYQNGRLQHLLGNNEEAIVALSDFCHQHYDDELYPQALYWIAESFYDEYNFDSAKGLYERIVADFFDCDKVAPSQYKLDLIEKRAREEKLLYLLKIIGEENLSTREEYERQLRIYEMEDKLGLNRELLDAQDRIAELERILSANGLLPSEGGSGYGAGGSEAGGAGAGNPAAAASAGDSSGSGGSGGGAGGGTMGTATVQVVNETSLHLNKKNKTSYGTKTLPASASEGKDVEALKRKARQLQYLLDDQESDGEK